MPDWAKLLITLTVVSVMGAAVGVLALQWQGEKRANAINTGVIDSVYRRLDSLARAESRNRDLVEQRHAEQLLALRAVQVALADSLRRVRGLIPPPDSTVRDSLRYWHSTAVVAEAENEQLRGALATSDSQVVALTVTVARVRAERDSTWARVTAMQRGMDRLAAEVGQLAKPCRIAGLIPCPSRTTTAALGAAATAITILAVK